MKDKVNLFYNQSKIEVEVYLTSHRAMTITCSCSTPGTDSQTEPWNFIRKVTFDELEAFVKPKLNGKDFPNWLMCYGFSLNETLTALINHREGRRLPYSSYLTHQKSESHVQGSNDNTINCGFAKYPGGNAGAFFPRKR